jgi:hypothetical protein
LCLVCGFERFKDESRLIGNSQSNSLETILGLIRRNDNEYKTNIFQEFLSLKYRLARNNISGSFLQDLAEAESNFKKPKRRRRNNKTLPPPGAVNIEEWQRYLHLQKSLEMIRDLKDIKGIKQQNFTISDLNVVLD